MIRIIINFAKMWLRESWPTNKRKRTSVRSCLLKLKRTFSKKCTIVCRLLSLYLQQLTMLRISLRDKKSSPSNKVKFKTKSMNMEVMRVQKECYKMEMIPTHSLRRDIESKANIQLQKIATNLLTILSVQLHFWKREPNWIHKGWLRDTCLNQLIILRRSRIY